MNAGDIFFAKINWLHSKTEKSFMKKIKVFFFWFGISFYFPQENYWVVIKVCLLLRNGNEHSFFPWFAWFEIEWTRHSWKENGLCICIRYLAKSTFVGKVHEMWNDKSE